MNKWCFFKSLRSQIFQDFFWSERSESLKITKYTFKREKVWQEIKNCKRAYFQWKRSISIFHLNPSFTTQWKFPSKSNFHIHSHMESLWHISVCNFYFEKASWFQNVHWNLENHLKLLSNFIDIIRQNICILSEKFINTKYVR